MSDEGKHVLVTGFPSAVSRETAILLSKQPAVKVVLLADAENFADAEDFADFVNRDVATLEGAVTKIDFGLSGREYLQLAEELDAIVHISLPPPPGSAGKQTLEPKEAAREIIELGKASSSISHIVVLSHLDVSGSKQGVFAEWDLDVGQDFSDAAGRARFKAEKIYRQFNQSLPITVLRAGWIVGRGRELCPLVQMILSIEDPESTFAKAPRSEINAIDLQTAAEVLSGLATSEWSKRATTLHLKYTNVPPIIELVREIQSAARRRAPAGFDLTAGAKRALRRSNTTDVWSVREFFKRQIAASPVATSLSLRYFTEHGWQIPAFDEDAMDHLVEKAVEKIVGFI